MKRSDIRSIFPDATKEQLDQIMEINGDDINAVKEKYVEHVTKNEHDSVRNESETLKEVQGQGTTSEEKTELETMCKFKTVKEEEELTSKKLKAIEKKASLH